VFGTNPFGWAYPAQGYAGTAAVNATVVAVPAVAVAVAPTVVITIVRDHPYADVSLAMSYA
jgi:hypothetical protein